MRLDQVLKAEGFYTSREKAQAAIIAGHVQMGGRVILKPSTLYDGSEITCMKDHVYVSRSALKLKGALDAFELTLKDKTVLDIGASTGGFTEVALEYGASHVTALDVGTEQLVPQLRSNPKVTSLEKTHILKVKSLEAFDLVVIDVSFISSLKVLDHLKKIMPVNDVLVLFKPQFETDQKLKHPVIKNAKFHSKIQSHYEAECQRMGYQILNRFNPIKGKEGNQETMYHLTV